MNATRIEGFWSRVDKSGACWIWTGAIYRGYGRATHPTTRKYGMAHRIAYELAVGPIPGDLTIDHLCMVKSCVNPAHLEPVTRGENVRRWADTVTECPQGHPYDAANTYVNPKTGKRQCRECTRLRSIDRPKRPCPECGKRLLTQNVSRHQIRVHGMERRIAA